MAQFSGIVRGTLLHDGVEFAHGATFETDDEKLFERLRAGGAVQLPGEAVAPEVLQQQAQQAAATIEEQRNRIAELEAQVRAQTENKAPKQKLPE